MCRLTSLVELLFLRDVVDAEYSTSRLFTVSPLGAGALSAKLKIRLLASGSIPSTDDLYSDKSEVTEFMVNSSSSDTSAASVAGFSPNEDDDDSPS